MSTLVITGGRESDERARTVISNGRTDAAGRASPPPSPTLLDVTNIASPTRLTND